MWKYKNLFQNHWEFQIFGRILWRHFALLWLRKLYIVWNSNIQRYSLWNQLYRVNKILVKALLNGFLRKVEDTGGQNDFCCCRIQQKSARIMIKKPSSSLNHSLMAERSRAPVHSPREEGGSRVEWVRTSVRFNSHFWHKLTFCANVPLKFYWS